MHCRSHNFFNPRRWR